MPITLPSQSRFNPKVFFLFAGIAVTLSLSDRTAPFDSPYQPDYLDFYLDHAIHQTLPGPHVYRILVPYTVHGASKLTSVPSLTIDFVLKVILLTFIQFIFMRYLRIFFDGFLSLVGVFLLDLYIAAALYYPLGPSLIETIDILNVLVFCLSLQAIHRKTFILLLIVLFLGTVNRETTWLLLPLVAIAHWPEKPRVWHILGAFLMVALPYFGLRLLIESPRPDWWVINSVDENIPFVSNEHLLTTLKSNARLALLLGPLIVLGAHRFRDHPHFLRLCSSVTPLFLAVHYVFGRIIEVRLWLPLLVILIPLALSGLARIIDSRRPDKAVSEL